MPERYNFIHSGFSQCPQDSVGVINNLYGVASDNNGVVAAVGDLNSMIIIIQMDSLLIVFWILLGPLWLAERLESQ